MDFKKEITIYDIAKETKYSPSTVSRALNDNKSISFKTIQKIKKAAADMGYRPNTMAVNLRNSKSNTIGIVISRINRPFVSLLISGIEETARKAGYSVIITQSNDIYDIEVSNAETLYNGRISGIISSLSMQTTDCSHFQKFADQGVPIVFVDRVPKLFNAYKIIIDNYTAGYNATKHLIEQGCKRIAHYSGLQHIKIYEDRKQGYIDALKAHQLPVDEDLIVYFETLSHEESRKTTQQLLQLPNPPDGIFAANDTAGVSAIICAKEMGVNIPEELCVIGFNDDPIASIVTPRLSTVSNPARKMGELSAQRILQHSNTGYDREISEITMLNTDLIIRESSNRLQQNKKAQ